MNVLPTSPIPPYGFLESGCLEVGLVLLSQTNGFQARTTLVPGEKKFPHPCFHARHLNPSDCPPSAAYFRAQAVESFKPVLLSPHLPLIPRTHGLLKQLDFDGRTVPSPLEENKFRREKEGVSYGKSLTQVFPSSWEQLDFDARSKTVPSHAFCLLNIHSSAPISIPSSSFLTPPSPAGSRAISSLAGAFAHRPCSQLREDAH